MHRKNQPPGLHKFGESLGRFGESIHEIPHGDNGDAPVLLQGKEVPVSRDDEVSPPHP